MAIFNFPLGFGSLKTIRKVLPIDLPRSQDIPSPLAFAEGLFFSNILQILILKYRFNIVKN